MTQLCKIYLHDSGHSFNCRSLFKLEEFCIIESVVSSLYRQKFITKTFETDLHKNVTGLTCEAHYLTLTTHIININYWIEHCSWSKGMYHLLGCVSIYVLVTNGPQLSSKYPPSNSYICISLIIQHIRCNGISIDYNLLLMKKYMLHCMFIEPMVEDWLNLSTWFSNCCVHIYA